MNKVIEVNEEFSYAVVEPGVTFTDLYDYCVLHRLKVWPSVPSLGWGSVIGNVSHLQSPHFRANQYS
jgi:FAD/FMN-containing dehydrogenase